MQYIIGLTGLIGSGKTMVASIFQEFGVPIVDTDIIAHQITQPGGAAIGEIARYFGDEFIDSSGGLDRSKMRKLVFKTPKERMNLEMLLHPLIFSSVVEQIKQNNDKYMIVVVPLLFKALKYLNLINRSIFVDCDDAILYERVYQRSKLTLSEVASILKSQTPRDLQIKLCDDIISNNGSLKQLREQIFILHGKYQNLFCTSLEK